MTSVGGYGNIIVIGYGRVTGEVIEHIYSLKEHYGYKLSYIEYEVHDFNQAMKCCRDHDIPFETIEDKAELTHRFKAIEEKTLIISASNNYLFPRAVVEKDNLRIINFHNALLPDLPGRNAPSWAIYEGRTQTGITWHYVNADVDAGDIIIQKECSIGEDEKAYVLADKLMHLATDAFKECFEDVLADRVSVTKQEVRDDRRIYRSYELPGDGKVSETDAPEKIYRILRAMDYGKTGVFPETRITVNGESARILRYKAVTEKPVSVKENTLLFPLNIGKWFQIKYDFN